MARRYNKYAYIAIFIILIIALFEFDRRHGDNGRSFPPYFYYVRCFPLPLIGLFNTAVRTLTSAPPVFDANAFPSHAIIKANWKDIQREAMTLYSKKEKMPDMDFYGTHNNFTDPSEKGWKTFVLKWYQEPASATRRACPRTSQIIAACPDIHAAMFSILEPGKRIPEHRGPSTAFLRYHLGLKVPKSPGCYITVDGQRLHWKEGEALVFDDTYAHSVQNSTDEPRIILFIDIERPALKGVPLTPLVSFSRQLNEVSERELPME